MNRFGVTPRKADELDTRMQELGIDESDLEERFITGGGPGGQKVNRSATAVHLKHTPSGIEVKMQRARSQGLNRFLARRRLCELLESALLGKASAEAQRAAKIRKQKARRKRRARPASPES